MTKFEACMKAINKIDDYFEYRHESDRDRKFVFEVIEKLIEELTEELKEIVTGE